MDELCSFFAEFGAVERMNYVNTYDRPLRTLGAWLDCFAVKRIVDRLRGLAPDVIHLNKQNLEDGLDIVAAVSRSRIPAVGFIHITQDPLFLGAVFPMLRSYLSRRRLKSFPGPWVTCPENREVELRKFLGQGAPPVHVVLNGIRMPDPPLIKELRERTRADLKMQPDDILVLATGRMTRQKRPDRFLAYAERVLQACPRARFLWVGDGDWTGEWDRSRVVQRYSDVIRRIPWTTDTPAYFSAADVFLHTADYEGLPYAVLEAMGHGLPVVLTRELWKQLPCLDSAQPWVLEDEALIASLIDRDVRIEAGKRCRSVCETLFDIRVAAAAYEKLYTESIRG